MHGCLICQYFTVQMKKYIISIPTLFYPSLIIQKCKDFTDDLNEFVLDFDHLANFQFNFPLPSEIYSEI